MCVCVCVCVCVYRDVKCAELFRASSLWLCPFRLPPMTVHLGRYLENRWPYYLVRINGGPHSGRWLQPMLRESTPQWCDDDGKTMVHLYHGTLPGNQGATAWWLLEVPGHSTYMYWFVMVLTSVQNNPQIP